MPFPVTIALQFDHKTASQTPLLTESKTHALTPIEHALNQAPPEAEKAPSWLRRTVATIADTWFDPKSYESPEIYEKLGVRTVKKYMPTGGDLVLRMLRKILGNGEMVEGNLASLKHMGHYTRLYESAHEVFLSIMAANIGEQLATGNIKTAIAETALNTLVNVFPIMLQRYNRIRLYRTINKMEQRQTRQVTLASIK